MDHLNVAEKLSAEQRIADLERRMSQLAPVNEKPSRWKKRLPWIALGAVAALVFAAAGTARLSREEGPDPFRRDANGYVGYGGFGARALGFTPCLLCLPEAEASRDASGNYTLPAPGVPFITGQTIHVNGGQYLY